MSAEADKWFWPVSVVTIALAACLGRLWSISAARFPAPDRRFAVHRQLAATSSFAVQAQGQIVYPCCKPIK